MLIFLGGVSFLSGGGKRWRRGNLAFLKQLFLFLVAILDLFVDISENAEEKSAEHFCSETDGAINFRVKLFCTFSTFSIILRLQRQNTEEPCSRTGSTKVLMRLRIPYSSSSTESSEKIISSFSALEIILSPSTSKLRLVLTLRLYLLHSNDGGTSKGMITVRVIYFLYKHKYIFTFCLLLTLRVRHKTPRNGIVRNSSITKVQIFG